MIMVATNENNVHYEYFCILLQIKGAIHDPQQPHPQTQVKSIKI